MENRRNRELRKRLEQLAELKFRDFSARLIPNIEKERVLGVRLPKLRKIAKELAKEDWRSYLKEASDESFEEVMLQGMVLGYADAELTELLAYIEAFLPKIDNWSVCDSFCSGLKLPRKYPEEMWEFVTAHFQDERPYVLRFAIVMLLFYYVDEAHCAEAFQYLDSVHHEDYYVKMAAAWAVSIFYIQLPQQTMEYLTESKLDDFTYNKALQKITESLKVDKEEKDRIRKMKRK